VAALLTVSLSACRQDMHDQPKYQPFERSAFFDDQRASRPLLPGTVARGQFVADEGVLSGRRDGALVPEVPLPVTTKLLERGQERFNIYCAPCHDRTGSGRGLVVERGFWAPQTFHSDRVRNVPDGYFYLIMKNGYGLMSSYAAQVAPEDRWAIVAYIRALQLSQNATLADVPESERGALERAND
jgi:mono/diheme cytochrome c family protein